MGTFHQQIELGDFDGERFEALEALVDTGATYTSVPSAVLDRLGVSPEEEVLFILANGQTVRLGMAWARIRLSDREQPTLVVFGEPASSVLLGAFTLEGFRLGVDSVNKRLIPTPGYLVGIRLDDRQ
ncbi:MAG TPA: retroviral-like aspartic protease family protein [Dehalococcoidia bacterium]|nr:retroviral-like aspartic protease family protein [Dehalococcoidia bacterium]